MGFPSLEDYNLKTCLDYVLPLIDPNCLLFVHLFIHQLFFHLIMVFTLLHSFQSIPYISTNKVLMAQNIHRILIKKLHEVSLLH
jgi:hypothetical protein